MINANDLVAKFRYALENGWGYIWGTAGVMWTQAKQNAATREQTVKYGSRWIGHMVADCSGLFSWAFRQLGGYMYHGSDTMYRKYCTEKGQLDGQDLQPGTAVFVYKKADNNFSHVGLYVGNGIVIEAASTAKGVVTSKVTDSKWTNWGWLKGVDGGDIPVPPEPVKPTLKRGSKGEYVTLAQTELINKGYSCGSFGADGQFGAATEAAVKRFQKDNGLTADGIIGPKTWAALDSTEPVPMYTVTILHLNKSAADALAAQYTGAIVKEE